MSHRVRLRHGAHDPAQAGTTGHTRTLIAEREVGRVSGARDMVATFGFALVFWQPGLTCSLDNPLVFPAESWVVGGS
jgi:hypothetical protein